MTYVYDNFDDPHVVDCDSARGRSSSKVGEGRRGARVVLPQIMCLRIASSSLAWGARGRLDYIIIHYDPARRQWIVPICIGCGSSLGQPVVLSEPEHPIYIISQSSALLTILKKLASHQLERAIFTGSMNFIKSFLINHPIFFSQFYFPHSKISASTCTQKLWNRVSVSSAHQS